VTRPDEQLLTALAALEVSGYPVLSHEPGSAPR